MHEGSTISHDVIYRNVQLQSFLHVECVLNVRSTPTPEILRTVYISVCPWPFTSDNNAFKDLITYHEILRQLSRVHEQCHQDGMVGYQYEVDLQPLWLMDSFLFSYLRQSWGPSADKLYFCASITHRNYHIRYPQVCKALFSYFFRNFLSGINAPLW